MRTITVEVTQDDIDQGRRRSSCECPVALAVKRATGAEWVIVGCSSVDIGDNKQPFRLPDDARQFISNYDLGFRPEPITFTLESESCVTTA